MSKTKTFRYDSETRFNWGYHDAMADNANQRGNKWKTIVHFDANYRAGYLSFFEELEINCNYEMSRI